MSSLFLRSLFLFTAVACAHGQTSKPPAHAHDEVLSLDTVLVSAGLQDKTAFDLAQGTSILAGDELRRRVQATLGETLAATPGVNSTYYGPGASRPIIRGLGGDRIRVLDGGIGALDASSISPDHNTAVEPLFAERIEVLRGPATLLYGSSAVGGVINVIDNRIPVAPLTHAATGAIEARGFGAAREQTVVAALSGGSNDLRVQLNGLNQRAGDLRIPGVGRVDAMAPADQPRGTLPNSGVETESGSLGATWFWQGGRFGGAVSSYATTYGIPIGEQIGIDLRQRRLDLAGETTEAFGIFTGLKARGGFGDYTHREIADRTITNTTFKNKAWEGRVELPHTFAENISGTLGAQASRSNFSAVGEEVVTPPSITQNQALFALEEWKRGTVTWQAGGRIERQSIALGDFDASALPTSPGYSAQPGRKKDQRGASGSLGAVFYPAKDWSIGLSLAYTERLPTAQELFSNGPHGGAGAYEIGTSGLTNEKSTGLDFSVRRRAGFATGTASVFVNHFKNYIFEEELDPAAIPAVNNPGGLTPYRFVAKDAEFSGAEIELSFHLIDRESGNVHVDLTGDYVRAQQTTDDAPLPRIPPLRYGVAVHGDRGPWHAAIEVRHTAPQNRVAAGETATPGFTLINADAGYTITRERVEFELFLRGTNLADAEARVHASFLKDFAPLAGRGFVAGVRVRF
ncbi:MAG TPA: TonB-dependent receptor [Opitutaceae bacterium]|nr:TonB-dependent receptor [Opitutaceae bacterium]